MTQPLASIKPIAQLGHPVLRKVAIAIEDITGAATQQLIEEMLATVDSAGGVGIAAPQIHHSCRLFIICSKPNQRYPNAPSMLPTPMINPRIIRHNQQTEKDWEGCLSVPSVRGLVPRYTQIDISYFDQQGQEHFLEFEGFLARVFQHELDHLDGITFVDRVESSKDLYSETEWYRQFVD